MHATTVPTPVGPFSLAADEHGVYAAGFTDDPAQLELPPWPPSGAGDTDAAAAAVRAYFAGEVRALDSVRINQRGDGFRYAAWENMRRIPPGQTRSYTELAASAGNPRAARAAGAACAGNLVPLFVPCHRIVRSDGSLGHYYYGLEIKRRLLEHERGA